MEGMEKERGRGMEGMEKERGREWKRKRKEIAVNRGKG